MASVEELNEEERRRLADMEAAFGVGAMAAAAEPAICVSLRREADLQFRFMSLYQWLVLVLAVMVLGLLAVAAWSAARGEPYAAVAEAAGAIATGVAAKFLLDQRQDARKSWRAATAGQAKHGCTAA